MTKAELIDALKDIPDGAEIDIYDLDNFNHPTWEINTETYYNYNTGVPIITIELNG